MSAHNRRAEAHNKRVVADYNRSVRAHHERLRREIAKFNATATTSRHTVYQRSVVTLRQSFTDLDSAASQPGWSGADDLLDLSESETANSVAALNALLDDQQRSATPNDPAEIVALRSSVITTELRRFGEDLQARWSGALFALHPANPDASRHFCTSARELMSSFLECVAPDAEVIAADPDCARTPRGSVSRRARVQHCLKRRGEYDETLEAFIEADLDNVISLFDEFNSGTHGAPSQFDLSTLSTIKQRVEGAIQFVARIAQR